MAPFTSILAFPPSVNHPTGTLVQWQMDPTFRPVIPFKFTLEVSEVPTFSELIYSKDVGDSFFAIDDSGLPKNIGRDYIYRVKLETGDHIIYYSNSLILGATPSERHKYLKAGEITRKELLRMRYTGFEAWLLKRKVFGVVASDVDEVSGAAMADTVTDHGVGIVGGYYDAISLIVSKEKLSNDRRFKAEGNGVEEIEDITVRVVGFPNVENRDIIVFKKTKERYSVAGITFVIFPGTDIQLVQNISLKHIMPTDTIYQIALPE